jgi:hypothetical protein
MKNFKSFPLTALLLLLTFFGNPLAKAQDSTAQRSQMLDLKLQLLDSKLDLLDTKIKLWEAKPKELDIRLNEIDSKVRSMDFDPSYITSKLNEMDSIIKTENKKSEERIYVTKQQESQEVLPVFLPEYNSAIMLDPVRLLEGTFFLSYERKFKPALSANVGLMATYSTKQGISNMYFSNQSFALFDASTNSYRSYQGEVMSGWGVNLQLRNYLLAKHPGRKKAPYGLYAAPQYMLRKLTITGNYKEMEEVEPGKWEMVETKVVQHLNINAGGVLLGVKVPFFKVLALDIFAGGNIKLSKYKGEDGFTRYKDWFNVDFSGVSPVAGISIGILK